MMKKKSPTNKLLQKFNNFKPTKKEIVKYVIIAFFVIWVISSLYAKFLPLPSGISVEGEIFNVTDSDIEFLYDLNYQNNGESIIKQEIFANVFEIIENASEFIVIDMFLFNTDYSEKVRYKNLTTDLKNALIEKKQNNPQIEIVFTTDEINNFYGDYVSQEIQDMEKNNISVIITDHTKMRDINFIYAGFWRSYLQWFGTSGYGWMPHALGRTDEKVTLRSYLKLMNSKANHRKVIVADQGEQLVSLITSANPHEASSKHSNVGVLIYGDIALDILRTELGVSAFSSNDKTIENIYSNLNSHKTTGDIGVQLLTEAKIRDNMISEIEAAVIGEKIEMVMFYLSDRRIIHALLDASERGVDIEIILDANKDAFAREKSGVPNRQAAWELVEKSGGEISIRWYKTNGEQQHSKITVIRKLNGGIIVFIGSANLTKRNIGDYNLEMNVKITSPSDTSFENEISDFFYMLWDNNGGDYTLDYEEYEDTSRSKYWQYRFQEATGFSTF